MEEKNKYFSFNSSVFFAIDHHIFLCQYSRNLCSKKRREKSGLPHLSRFVLSLSFIYEGKGVGIIFLFPQSFPFLLLRNRKSSFLSFLFGVGSARFVVYPLNIPLFPTFFFRSYHLTQIPPHYTQGGGTFGPRVKLTGVTRTNPIFRGLRIRALNRIPTQASLR